MTTVTTILADLESALASRSEGQKKSTITRVTEMFVERADEYTPEQVGVFDVVIGRLAAGVDVQVRIDLSERLAALAMAPHGVVRQLALDEIGVARPVLTRSIMLSESDLIAVASTKGRDHMLAITERQDLTAPVTDYLVVKGDRVISHALAHNETARFSPRGMGLLVTRAFTDDALQVALGGRDDIPPELVVNLSNAARDSARRRLLRRPETAAPAGYAAGSGVENEGPRPELTAAYGAMRDLAARSQLDEKALAGFAQRAATDEAICVVSLLAKISLQAAEQAVLGTDRDASLVIGKAMGWEWPTVKALIGLRPASERLPQTIERARHNYDNLSSTTAHRVLQFMRVKEQAASK